MSLSGAAWPTACGLGGAAVELRKRDPDNQDAIAFAEEAAQTARDALG
jgi:hypothetical protein